MLGSRDVGYKGVLGYGPVQRSEMIPKSSVLIYFLNAEPLDGVVMSSNT